MPQDKSKTKAKPSKKLSSQQRAKLCAQAAAEMQAEDIIILEIGKLTSFTDYFVIVSGRSNRQVQAITDKVIEDIKASGNRPLGSEGEDEGRWVLIDWGDVVVHVFHHEERDIYELEKLWSDGTSVTFSQV